SAGVFVTWPVAALPRKAPKGAIKRIARPDRRHRRLQSLAVEAAIEPQPHRIDLRHNAIDGFAIASIWDAFTAAARHSVAQFRDYGHRFGFDAAADAKGAGNGPVLDRKCQGQRQIHREIQRSSRAAAKAIRSGL